MLNSSDDIKRLWPGEALNIDDETAISDSDERTNYDVFIEQSGAKIRKRLVTLVGSAAIADAELESPTDETRADCVKEAELELFHTVFIEKLWRDKSAGTERDIQLPSGMRITLEAFSDYENIIKTHIGNACRVIEDYLCY